MKSFDAESAPAKSSLSEFRNKVKYDFFEQIFDNQLCEIDSARVKIKNYFVYAIDGEQLDLAPSKDLIENGLRGHKSSVRGVETHYLKMYTCQAYDVVNGLIKEFNYSTSNQETYLAQTMIERLEKNSISIYDRHHCGYQSMFSHELHGSKFLIRARFRGEGSNIQKDILKFSRSKKRSAWINWEPNWFNRGYPALRVRLVRIRNPRSNEDMIFMSNLSDEEFSDNEIGQLYLRRWDIEGSFRDLTSTLKIEQWHSKTLNGCLQEIFAAFWLMNTLKFNAYRAHLRAKSWFKRNYRKANIKLAIEIFDLHLHMLFEPRGRFFLATLLRECVRKSSENRRRLSRSFPRVVKKRGNSFPNANLVTIRP